MTNSQTPSSSKNLPSHKTKARKQPRDHSGKIPIFFMLSAAFFLAAIFFGVRFFFWNNASNLKTDFFPASEVVALGRLVPVSDVVTLGAPFGANDASVAALLAREGETLKKGRVIALLDNMPHLEASLLVAASNVRIREAALAQTRVTIQAAYREALAAKKQAESLRQIAKTEFERSKALNARGVASNSAYDRADGEAEKAQRAYEIAQARLSRYAGVATGTQVDVLLKESQLAEARATLAKARSDLVKGRVTAPINGTLIKLNVQVGERLPSEGIAKLGDLSIMNAKVEVYQTDVARVSPGQTVVMTSEALPGVSLSGTVEKVGFEVEQQDFIRNDPAAHTDARIVKVLVRLEAEASQRVKRLTGLEIVARIKTRDKP